MKKIISIALCAVMLISTAIFTTNASTASNVISDNPHFELVGEEIYVPANKILKSTYNLKDSTYPYYIKLTEPDNSKNYVNVNFTDCQTGEKYVNVASNEYYTWFYKEGSGSRGAETVNFNKGAYYQKIRVRLCDFDQESFSYQYQAGELVRETHGYFLEDGSYFHSDTDYDKTFNYKFNRVEGVENSGMIIICGATMTAVKPDSEGMVEFYVKKDLENGIPDVKASGYDYTHFTLVFGGNLKMGVGNVEMDTAVNVKDATLIQKYCADLETLSTVQKYFADVNSDGRINVIDSTEIQKYCVGA